MKSIQHAWISRFRVGYGGKDKCLGMLTKGYGIRQGAGRGIRSSQQASGVMARNLVDCACLRLSLSSLL